MSYIVFDTEAESENAWDICWLHYLEVKVAPGRPAVDADDKTYTDLTGLTDAQILALQLCGRTGAGKPLLHKGATAAYQTWLKAYSLEKWFTYEPPSEYLELLSGYTVKTDAEVNAGGYYPPDTP